MQIQDLEVQNCVYLNDHNDYIWKFALKFCENIQYVVYSKGGCVLATEYSRTPYVNGSAVRKQNPRRDEYRTPHRVVRSSKKQKRQAMDLGFVLFLTAALIITGFTCIQYINLQTSITSSVDEISQLKIELEEKKAANDDTECRIKGAVDLEFVKKRAMDDLGMTYAREDQIVIYESDGTDYVRQYVSLE